jgi:chitodextrinase
MWLNYPISRTTSLVALLVTLCGAACVTLTSEPVSAAESTTCTVSAKLVNSCRPWLGAESGDYGTSGFREAMLEHEARIGRKLDIVHEYLGAGDVLTDDVVSLAKRPSTIALVNWRVNEKWADADGRSSSVNADIDKMADSIKALGSTKIMLTLVHEPENDISPGGDANCPELGYKGHSGGVKDYVNMWHNVRSRFDAKGITNVVWVMNYMGWKGWNCVVRDLWPGNAYVDWVTWDPYPKNSTWTQFVGSFYNFLTENNDATHNFLSKPWGLSEFGYVGSSQAAAYAMYDDARRDLQNNVFPKLKAYVVWDQHTSQSHDDRVGYAETGVADPVEQAHYNAFANDPLLKDPVPGAGDVSAPSAPTGLQAVARRTSVDLRWSAAKDDVGVARYYLFRNNAKYQPLGNVTSFTDTAVTPGTRYIYKVYAIDAAGHWSRSSTRAAATPDQTAPTAPTGLSATAGTNQATLSWSAAQDDVGVAKYYLFRDNAKYRALGNVTTFTDTRLTSGATYTYKVYAIDAVGNWSRVSNHTLVTAR